MLSIWTSLLFCRLVKDYPLPNDKILNVTKLKAFAEDKLIIVKMMISLYNRVENTGGKGENAGHQHFFLYPQHFPKPSSLGSLKVLIVLYRVRRSQTFMLLLSASSSTDS